MSGILENFKHAGSIIKLFTGHGKPEDLQKIVDMVMPFITDENIAEMKAELVKHIQGYQAQHGPMLLMGRLSPDGGDIEADFYTQDSEGKPQYHASLDIDKKLIIHLLNMLLKHVARAGNTSGQPQIAAPGGTNDSEQ